MILIKFVELHKKAALFFVVFNLQNVLTNSTKRSILINVDETLQNIEQK